MLAENLAAFAPTCSRNPVFHDTKLTSVGPSNLQWSFHPRRFDANQTSDVPVAFTPPYRSWFELQLFFRRGVAEPSLHRLVSVKRTSLEQTRTPSIAECLFSTRCLSTSRRVHGCQQELSPRTSHRDRAFSSFDALALHESVRFCLSLTSPLFFRRPCGAIRKRW
jgi:hypothetical protein